MTAPAPAVTPGVYDIPAEDYHADPIPGGSLSSSGARLLLSTCPALFRYQQDNPPKPKREFDLGHAASAEDRDELLAALGLAREVLADAS